MFGINSFYYSEIIKYKRKIRNTLLLFIREDNDEKDVITTINDLAPLFLVDHDNIDKEIYNDEELKIANAIIEAYINDENMNKTLSKKQAKAFVDLAMNKRLSTKANEVLAMKLAEYYNETCNNELLLIDLNIFKEVCRSIDDKNAH